MRIPQIQALRAFAAVLVVIYHAKITSGGYIGVDIFFVISGYLITRLILNELLLEKNYIIYGIIRRSSSINTCRIDHLFNHERLFLKYEESFIASISNETFHLLSAVLQCSDVRLN